MIQFLYNHIYHLSQDALLPVSICNLKKKRSSFEMSSKTAIISLLAFEKSISIYDSYSLRANSSAIVVLPTRLAPSSRYHYFNIQICKKYNYFNSKTTYCYCYFCITPSNSLRMGKLWKIQSFLFNTL